MKLAIAFILMAVSLWGCGGGGGGGSSTPSPFAGTFDGTWTATGDSGTAHLTIANSGNVAGSTHSTALDEDGSVSGHISSNGNVSGTYSYPSTGNINVSGTLVLSNGGNTLSGSITGSGVTTNFILARQ
jgi:hypothetical protein